MCEVKTFLQGVFGNQAPKEELPRNAEISQVVLDFTGEKSPELVVQITCKGGLGSEIKKNLAWEETLGLIQYFEPYRGVFKVTDFRIKAISVTAVGMMTDGRLEVMSTDSVRHHTYREFFRFSHEYSVRILAALSVRKKRKSP